MDADRESQKVQKSLKGQRKNQVLVNDIHHARVRVRVRVRVQNQKSKSCFLKNQIQKKMPKTASSCSSACQSLLRLAPAELLSAP